MTTNTERALELRVRDLEAAHEIYNLEAEYSQSWDTGQADRWAAVFIEDGAFELVALEDRPGRRVEGSEALRRFCLEVNGHTTGIHLMHMPRVVVDGDTARGWLYFEFKKVVRSPGGETALGSSAGYYDVTYVRTPQGWRMKERIEKGVIRTSQSFSAV